MPKPVSCTNEVLLLVRFKKPCLGATGLNYMNKPRLVLAQKFQSYTIFHLGLGNAFERLHCSASDSTSNHFLYVWLLSECEPFLGWNFPNFYIT